TFPPMMTSFVTHALVFPSSLRATLSDIAPYISMSLHPSCSLTKSLRLQMRTRSTQSLKRQLIPSYGRILSCFLDVVPQIVL
ncbi:hypothetical protein BDZ97DRAFT_1873964, partial [Flammula alnicola]